MVTTASVGSIEQYLESRLAAGAAPGTVRKERAMIVSFYQWAWRHGLVTADTLMSVRAVPVPPGSTGVARPKPYSSKEMHALWAVLDDRWPRLPDGDAALAVRRWVDGRGRYSRVRSHLVHLRLRH